MQPEAKLYSPEELAQFGAEVRKTVLLIFKLLDDHNIDFEVAYAAVCSMSASFPAEGQTKVVLSNFGTPQ